MNLPYDERSRAGRAPPGAPGGRFVQQQGGRNGFMDPRSQLMMERQLLLQQQQRTGNSSTVPRPRRATGGATSEHAMEMEKMKRTISNLQEQLAQADENVALLKKKEKEANDKKAQEIQKEVETNGRFENLSQGVTRPSQIVEKYGNLYTQGRLDAMDDLDQIAGLSKYGKHQEMKQKVLYGIMVASYKVAYDYLHQLKLNVRRLLGIPEKHPSNEKDAYGEVIRFLTTYFQSTTQTFNVEPIVEDVQEQLAQLLPEFPSLSKLPGISSYSAECCRIAWAMVNQIPPMELEHSLEKYNGASHTRFHASSEKNAKIKMYVWPALVDASDKSILYKGVVWT